MLRITDRRDFVFHHGIFVHRQPVPETRYTISEIKTGAPVAGVVPASGGIGGGKERKARGVQIDGKLRPSPHSRAPDSKLEIRGGLEAHFDPVHHRLAGERAPQREYYLAILSVYVVLTGHLGHPKLGAGGAEEAENPR